MIAEKAAWDYVRDHEVSYQLVTLCPGMVFGKMIHPIESISQLNVSNGIVWDVLKGSGIPPTKAPGKSAISVILIKRIILTSTF